MGGMGEMGLTVPGQTPKGLWGSTVGPAHAAGDGSWHRGDTAPKNPELNPSLALPDCPGGSSSDPHPGLILAPFWLCLCAHSPGVGPASPSLAPHSRVAQGSQRPLCPGGPPVPPHGSRGLCRDRALPERRHWEHPQTFPATLACPGRGLYLDLQEEKPGERSLRLVRPARGSFSDTGKVAREPLAWLSLTVPSQPDTALWPLRAHWLLPPSSVPCLHICGDFVPFP